MKITLIKDKETKYEIIDDKTEIPEGRYSLLISNLDNKQEYEIWINDEYFDTIKDSAYSTNIDFINKIGYFKYDIVDSNKDIIRSFKIYNSTYKLSKDFFFRMIDYVADNIFWKGNQFVYFDQEENMNTIVDPIFIYNWIDKNIYSIKDLILKINSNYNKDLIINNKKTFRNTNKYNKRKTISYLRNNTNLLVEDMNGIIQANGKKFNPQSLIYNEETHNIKTNEHLQIGELIIKMYIFIDENKESILKRFKDNVDEQKIKNNLETWIKELVFLKNNTFLSDISSLDIMFVKRYPKSQIQISDLNYGKIYELYKSFITDYYNFIDNSDEKTYQHIKNIDKIYEAFCCYQLADILELEISRTNMLTKGIAFRNKDFKLYYQTKPSSLKGWALNDTPDIIIKQKDGKVLILDSKFKVNDGEVKGEDIQKLQAYMNNYFVNVGGILYPGEKISSKVDELRNIYEIVSIPLYPWDKDKYETIKIRIREKIEYLLRK